MSNARVDLRAWVDAWAGEYPSGDEFVDHLWGADELDSDGWVTIIKWKFQMDPRRRARALAGVESEPDSRLKVISRDARRCEDDLAALRVVMTVPSIGTATGSAVLAVMDPTRWTVYDWRADASLKVLASTHGYVDPDRVGVWRDYVGGCRAICADIGVELRKLDRALWAAKGDPELSRSTPMR